MIKLTQFITALTLASISVALNVASAGELFFFSETLQCDEVELTAVPAGYDGLVILNSQLKGTTTSGSSISPTNLVSSIYLSGAANITAIGADGKTQLSGVYSLNTGFSIRNHLNGNREKTLHFRNPPSEDIYLELKRDESEIRMTAAGKSARLYCHHRPQ